MVFGFSGLQGITFHRLGLFQGIHQVFPHIQINSLQTGSVPRALCCALEQFFDAREHVRIILLREATVIMEHCCKMGKQKTCFVFRYEAKVVQRIHKESNSNLRDELGNIWSSQQTESLKTDKEHTKQDNRKD